MRFPACLILAVLTAPMFLVLAQETEKKEPVESVAYKVELVIHDGNDAAAKTGRRYIIMVGSGGRGTFRVGNRVPYQASGGTFQYADVGVNIDARVREQGEKVSLGLDIEISSQQKTEGLPSNPTISQLKIGLNTLILQGKMTPIASIDDPVTLKKFDVDAMVTRAN